MNLQERQQILRLIEAAKTQPSEELESEKIELKGYRDEVTVNNSKDLSDEVCSLANKSGGFIIIGIKDSKNIENEDWASQLNGFPHCDQIELIERLKGRIKPAIELRAEWISYESKEYLVIQVPHRPDVLVSTSSGKYYIRDGRTSRPMEPGELEGHVRSLTSYDWSSEIISLGPDEVLDQTYLESAKSEFEKKRGVEGTLTDDAFLEAIGATTNGQLTQGGLIFLGNEQAIRSNLGLHEYRFSWRTRAGGLKINDVWEGCLWKAILKSKSHFNQCNNIGEFTYKDEKFNVPLMDDIAFHEAYLNALVHRDYSEEGMVSVNFTGSEIKITSPGTFYGGVTPENIGKHEPRHRNKVLAKILMLFNLVDRAGMGVVRMGLGSLKYGRNFPTFIERDDSVEVSMQAEYLKASITVLSLRSQTELGVPELLILNMVHEKGYENVENVMIHLGRITDNPWDTLKKSVDLLQQVELCGSPDGIFIRTTRAWSDFLDVDRIFRIPQNSHKHVALYDALQRYDEVRNSDIIGILGYKYSSQVSRFLKNAKYVSSSGGSGVNSIWRLN